jgi:phosphoribosylformylglycinamidine cyclo-ligase
LPSGAYNRAGVDYASLDAGKRLALNAALATSGLLAPAGRALDESRGEPAFVFEFAGRSFAFVLEGLGTKSIIARQVMEELGMNRFADVAIDTVAAIVNDLCCVGALPLVVNAYFATGRSDWYHDAGRFEALLDGWRRACEIARCTWGGGESPSLPELVEGAEIELAGSAIGAVPEGRRPILGGELEAGDKIVLVASSGLHANGSSLARMLVNTRLPERYRTVIDARGTMLGPALLEPSRLYAPLVDALLHSSLFITYFSHITGHGLLKLMRPPNELTHRIWSLLPVPSLLEFLAREARMDHKAAYSTLNMGNGYAIYCRPDDADGVVEVARSRGYHAIIGGEVERGPRRVILEPVGVTYESDQLRLAPEGT